MNHLFYQKIIGTGKPIWLSEGLALNIDGSKCPYKEKVDPKVLYYSFEKNKIFKNANKFYIHSFLATRYLLKSIGKTKLINLLKKYSKDPKRENYIRIFGNFLNNLVKEST